MLKNLPRQYNPPGNGKRDMESLLYADPVEKAFLAAHFGSGKMTKHGIPSFSWRDDSGSDTNGTQDGSGGSMGGGGSVSGTGGGGFGGNAVTGSTGTRDGYMFRGVPGTTNIGNWNTGGPKYGFGSVGGGIMPRGALTLGMNDMHPLNGPQRPMMTPPPVTPPIQPPITPPPAIPIPRQNPWTPIGTAIDYFDAANPGGLNASTFPARPGVSPMAPGLNSKGPWGNGTGSVGAGRGGGGGGGW